MCIPLSAQKLYCTHKKHWTQISWMGLYRQKNDVHLTVALCAFK